MWCTPGPRERSSHQPLNWVLGSSWELCWNWSTSRLMRSTLLLKYEWGLEKHTLRYNWGLGKYIHVGPGVWAKSGKVLLCWRTQWGWKSLLCWRMNGDWKSSLMFKYEWDLKKSVLTLEYEWGLEKCTYIGLWSMNGDWKNALMLEYNYVGTGKVLWHWNMDEESHKLRYCPPSMCCLAMSDWSY